MKTKNNIEDVNIYYILDEYRPDDNIFSLENENIKKITFDSKALKHILYKYGVKINGISFDCLIARYLINSIAKPNVTLNEVLVENNIDMYI